MEVNRFLNQVYKNLPKHDDVQIALEDNVITVGFGENNGFEIRCPGGVCFTEGTDRNGQLEKLVDEAEAAIRSVREYLNLMDNSTELKARDFEMPYKKLAEFNGVVLGGIEHKSRGSFEFTTWEFGNNALYHGHYYTK